MWRTRVFANGGSIFSSAEGGPPGEDCPMLRTQITGLIPTLEYNNYAYSWNADNATWRGRVDVDTVQPVGPLPGYNGAHFTGSAFAPMTNLSITTPVYNGLNPRFDLTPDAAGLENEGHFANSVLLVEGNRLLCEVFVGRFLADAAGYEVAPFIYGGGCGNPIPDIGYNGTPTYNLPFEVTLLGAPANSIALPVVGFSNTMWSGIPLPLDLDLGLGLIGLTPGCPLNVSPDVIGNLLTDPSGACVFPITLSSTMPATLYWQWGVLTPTDLVMSRLLETTFHR